MSLNPSTWPAKTQALAVLVLAALVAVANSKFGWNLDAHAIDSVIGLGGVGALAVAHIDNGEPAVPVPAAVDVDKVIESVKAALAAGK